MNNAFFFSYLPHHHLEAITYSNLSEKRRKKRKRRDAVLREATEA